MRAALIYQHATGEADRQIAERLSHLVDEHQRQRRRDDDDGDADALVSRDRVRFTWRCCRRVS
jgi:hypothetical protein